MTFFSSVLCLALLWSSQASVLPTTPNGKDTIVLNEADYSFEQFVSDFGRYYHDPLEFAERRTIFYDNLKTIVSHNLRKKDEKGYWMGINSFADQRAHELPRGYDMYQSSLVRSQQASRSNRRLSQREQARVRQKHEHASIKKLGIEMEPTQYLPQFVDWRTKGVTTPIKNQGMCGSCWAFASTAVLESHIAIETGVLFELSPQELVSCAPNNRHCGGTGGCAGATAELAFDLVKQSGIVEEWSFGYQDGKGAKVNCTLIEHHFYTRHSRGVGMFHGAVAGITDYGTLPTNNYTVLMNVVAKLGPVTVSVACMPWHLYKSGVFYAPLSPGEATDLDHLVVLEGYGTDEETGEDYWIVRNSWGPRWGEKGYIRLKRIGLDECGVDKTPEDGTACTLDPDGNEIVPQPQLICGNSGILYDSSIPLGGFLI